MAMLSINGRLGLCALQRLSSLLPSGAPAEEKMQAAAVVCEALTETLAADVKKREHRNKVLLDCIVEQVTHRTRESHVQETQKQGRKH